MWLDAPAIGYENPNHNYNQTPGEYPYARRVRKRL